MKSLITPIIFILASIGIFVWYVDPSYQNFNTLRAQAVVLDDTLTQSKTLDQVWQSLVDKNNSITADDSSRLDTMLPTSIDTIRLITEMNSIAAAHGIVIQKLDISGTAAADDSGDRVIGPDRSQYGTLTFSFGFSAPYDTFLSFLSDLEHSLQLIDVTSLSLSSGQSPVDKNGNPTGPAVYGYSISAQTYWLKQ